jgi:hypothetical protein
LLHQTRHPHRFNVGSGGDAVALSIVGGSINRLSLFRVSLCINYDILVKTVPTVLAAALQKLAIKIGTSSADFLIDFLIHSEMSTVKTLTVTGKRSF